MKKIFSFIMLLTLFCGVGWAAETTYSMTPNQQTTGSNSTAYVTSLTEFTYNQVSWKMNQWNPKTLQIKTNQSSATSEFRFYNTSAFSGRITKVVITFKTLAVSDANKLMFLGGTSEVTATTGGTAGTWDETNLTLTWEPDANTDYTYFAFYQDGKAASGTNFLAEEDAIVVTYEGGSEPPTPTYQTIPYTESLVSSQGQFTIEDVSLGGLTAVWKTSQYGMTANGYNCTGDIESWFISPLIDGTTVSAINLNFDESLNFFANDEAAASEATLWVREGADGEWVNVTIPTHTVDATNGWHNAGDIDLSAYAGKVFQIAFKFTATTTNPGRWELKNLAITEGVEPPAEVATVAEFNALDQGKEFVFTGTGLIATVQKGKYLYAQDETGGMLIYGTITPEYALGDIIPAGFSAKKGAYNGAPQAGDPADFEDAVDSGTITAKEFAAADFAAATFAELSNFGIYGVVRGVTVSGNSITLADGETTVATYNTFADVPESTSGNTYDVYGIMGWHNGLQFLPTEYVQMATTAHAAPTITVNPDQETYFVGDEVTVKFTSEETDVNIGYDIEDTETFPAAYRPLGNGDSITVTLNEPGVVNVRAFAYGYNEGDVLGNSEVVTKTLTFVAKPELGDQYELVTSADQIAADKEYVLAYSDETVTVAMGAADTYGSNNVRVSVEAGSSEFTLEDGVITLMSTTTVTPFTLETSETEGFYNIKIDDDQYIYWTSGNTAATGSTLGDVTVALDSVGNALIKYNVTEDRYLQYNASSPRFCFYKGTQKYPQLYVKKAATPAYKIGDVNGDGEVDVRDITALIDVIMNSITDNPRADVSEDGEIDVRDITALIDIIMNS